VTAGERGWTDWVFSAEHPLLWRFSLVDVIYVNAPFDVRELTDRLIAREMPFVERRHLLPYLDAGWLPVAIAGGIVADSAPKACP
jgi:hypothetical protein